MNDDTVHEIVDMAAVAEDDALLSALSAGQATDGDGIGALLNAWRDELAAAPVPVGDVLTPSPDTLSVRHVRFPRRAAAGLVAAAMVAGGGVAAAAASGPTGPLGRLHQVLFGGRAPATAIDRAAALLDAARQRIDSARLAGGIAADQRAAVGALVDQAAALLSGRPDVPSRLVQLLADLRTELALLPDVGAAVPETPVSGAPVAPSGTNPSGGSAGNAVSGANGGGGDGSGSGSGGRSGGSDGGSGDGPTDSPTSTDGGEGGGGGGSSNDGGVPNSDGAGGGSSGGGSSGGSSSGGGSGGGGSSGGGSGGGGSNGPPPSPSPSTGQSTSSAASVSQPHGSD